MRVLVLTPWYPHRDHTHAGIFVREHARAVASSVEITVVHLAGFSTTMASRFEVEEETDPELTAGIPTCRIRFRSPPLKRWYALSLASGLRRAFPELVARWGRPDILHAHTFEAAFPAAALGKHEKIPLVVTEHHSGFQRGNLGFLARHKAKVGLERAHRVLPVCLSLEEAIMRHGIKARFRVIPNAVDPSVFHPPASACRSHRLVFVGSLQPLKGLPELLAGLARMNDIPWELHLAGVGPQAAEYRELGGRLGLSSRLHWHGAMLKPDLAELLRASRALVLPSRVESLPCVILEAMATGLPVLATRVGGIPEIVDETNGVLIEPRDVDAIEAGIRKLLSRDFDNEAIAVRARRFTLAEVGREILEVYEHAVAEPASRR